MISVAISTSIRSFTRRTNWYQIWKFIILLIWYVIISVLRSIVVFVIDIILLLARRFRIITVTHIIIQYRFTDNRRPCPLDYTIFMALVVLHSLLSLLHGFEIVWWWFPNYIFHFISHLVLSRTILALDLFCRPPGDLLRLVFYEIFLLKIVVRHSSLSIGIQHEFSVF